MIEFGKITGTTDNNLVEVRLRTGVSFLAPLAVVGTGVTLPSVQWVSDNKDNFLALVAYEKDIYENPLIIGFYPVKGADSTSYNTTERLLTALMTLMEQLLKAKVNTMMGPQPFMPDTIQVFNEVKTELESIKSLILPLKL